MQDYDLPNAVAEFVVLRSTNLTANADGPNIDLINYQGVIDFCVDVAAPSNLVSSPKLNFVFQTSADAITYTDIPGANVNMTNTNTFTQVPIDTRSILRYARYRANISGGNSPGYPASVQGIAQLKYNPS